MKKTPCPALRETKPPPHGRLQAMADLLAHGTPLALLGKLFGRKRLAVVGLGLICTGLPSAARAAIWMETDIGIGAYDYIEKDTTTFVHYGVNWSSWNRTEAWVDVNGSGAAYAGSWAHDASPNKHLSTGNLNSGSHGANWIAGSAIDVYTKIDHDGSDPWTEEASYVDDWMIFDVIKTDIAAGTIWSSNKALVLQFKIDVGSNSGRELTRLWVDNSGGTLDEDNDINVVKLYYENGTSLSFDGTESSVTLGAGGSGTDEIWGSDSLNISIPTGSDDLLCYVVIESWRANATAGRTARFQIINDGISMDQFGSTDKKLARINATQNANSLTLRGVYYSTGSVTPTTTTNWKLERGGTGSSPANFTSGDVFVIQNGHNMGTTAGWTVSGTGSKIQIESGGTLTANNLVAVPNFQIDDGGTYIHLAVNGANGASTDIPGSTTRSFGASSTVEIRKWGDGTGTSLATLPTGVTWGNLTINVTTVMAAAWAQAGAVTTIIGNFTMNSLGSTTQRDFRLTANTPSPTVSISGNLAISGGTLNLSSGTGVVTLNLGGNFNQTGGTLTSTGSGVGSINFTGGSSSVTWTKSAGTLTGTGINFTIASGKTVTMNNGWPVEASRSLTVNSGGTLMCGANNVTGGGTFTLSSGATLGIGSSAGIVALGTASGNIQTTTARSYNTGANYIYNGTTTPQAAGSGLPATVNNLTINNATANAVVNLAQNTTVNGALTLTAGDIGFSAGDTVILGSSATVSGGSSSSYIAGKLQKPFAVASGQSFTFPVGSSTVYSPVALASMTVGTAGNLTVNATATEHPQIATSGIDSAKSVNRYWTLTDGGGLVVSTCAATFNFVAGDLDGGANTANFIVGKYLSSAWTLPSVGTKTSTSTQATGLSSFGDFAVGEAAAPPPSITLADNGTQVTAANVAAGTTTHVLHKFSLAVTTADATLNTVNFTTAGSYDSDDLTNLKLRYSTDATLDGGDATLSTLNSPAAAGAKSFGSLSQVITSGSTGYLFITADIASAANAGATVSVNAIGTGDLTFAAGNKSGSTTAGGAQTITSAVTIDNTGAPAAGNIAAGTSDAVVFGFRISPATGSINFTGLSLDTAGTATTSDMSNFEVVYDADNSGTYNVGDSIVSSAAQSLADPISFTISGQTGFSAARRYLVIADVSGTAAAGGTFTGNVAASGDVTTTGTESGTASGNQQTITSAVTIGSTGNPAASNVPQGTADVVLFGFQLSPASGSIDFTGLFLGTAGTATSSDLSNFEVVRDTDSSGTYNAGDSIVSSAAQSLANPISFTITGQTGFSAARRYLLIADVAGGATTGRTFSASIGSATNVITTGTESGTVSGNTHTIVTSQPARWTLLSNRGTPLATYSVGDYLAYVFEFAINTDTSGWTIDYGVGSTTDGSGWTWRAAEWSQQIGSDRYWKSKASEHLFTTNGTFYYAGRFITNSYTYYAATDWVLNSGEPLSAASYFTVNALGAPSNVTAALDGTHPATRVDVGWAQWNSKNVMITRATAVPTGSPTNGTTYSAGNAIGNQTVVAGSQGGTAFEVTGLTPGQTYYFTVYTANNGYYSTGVTATAITMDMPKARNTSGGSPQAPAAIYLGDTGLTFGFDSWGQIEANYGAARLWLRYNNSDLTGGTPSAWTSFVNTDNKTRTSGLFNQTGTWYWGMQMDYGSPYETNFWYKASSASWASLSANGTGASLTVTVNAINDPGSQTATRNAGSPTSQIDLTWAKNAQSHNVMVVRKLSTDSWTEPTQGTAYTAGNSIGSGVVVYNGSATSANATGLAAGTTYDFKFYSVNNDYYSAGVTAQATTLTAEPTTQAHTVTFSSLGSTSMTVGWTSGNGAGRLVIARQGSAPSGGPVDGTTYTADGNFSGSGSSLGSGKVVYIGTGNSFSLSGLTAQTEYYLQVFEYSGSGASINYLTTTATGNPGNRYTLSTEPSSHVSTFTATASSGSSIELEWDAATGAGGYLILRKEGSAPTGAPADGTSYSQGSTIGDGTVVYVTTSGAAASTTDTYGPLTDDTAYYYLIFPFAYNGTPANLTYNYRTAATVPGANDTTWSAPIVFTQTADPSNPSDPTQASASGNVSSDGGDTVTERGIVWNTTGAPTTADNKVAHASGGLGTYTNTLTGLTPGQTIYYRAYAINSVGTGYGATSNFVADCFTTGPTSSAGTSITTSSFTANWSTLSGATGYRLDVSTNANFGSAGNVALQDFETSPATPTATYSASGGAIITGSSASGDRPATSPHYSEGSRGYEINNGTATLTFDAIDTSSAGDLQLTLRLASFSVSSTANGADVGDTVEIQVSPDNGVNYYPTVRVKGNSNAYWSYSGGTGNAATAYDGNSTAVEFSPAAGGSRTTDGYSTMTVSNLPSVSQLRIKVVMVNNTANERWTIDDLRLTGTIYQFVSGYGNKSVAGTSDSVTSLAENTTYYYRVRAVGAGSCVSPNSATQTVTTLTGLAAEPTTQAYGITFPARTKTSLDVAWTNGNGARRIVVARMTSAVSWTPSDAVAPSGVNADFSVATDQGSGNKIVYDGTGSSFTLTGLFTNTIYHVRVFEYNGTGATVNYLTSTATGNPASQATRDNEPGIGIGGGLSPSGTVGTNPSDGSFTVTNIAGSALSYSVSDDAAWLSVSPTTGSSLTNLQTQAHTVSYNVSGLTAGTYNATITITGTGTGENAATNSPRTLSVTLTLNNLPDPTAQSATADGKEMVRLAWTKNASYDVLIVRRAGSAPVAPTQGTSYSVGGTTGTDSYVIHKGAGSAIEDVLTPGVTYHYAFYSISNNHYSPGVSSNATLGTYLVSEIVEPFAYTNTGSLATSGHGNGGYGWTNAWQGDTSVFDITSSNLANLANYPNRAGNAVKIDSADLNDTSKSVRRGFTEFTSGVVYVGFKLNYQYNGANKFAGVSFMDGTTEKMFFGEGYNGDQKLAVGGNTTSIDLLAGSANSYIVIGKYDFGTDQASILLYKIGTDTVPTSEPGSWQATHTDSSLTRIDGVRLAAGAGAGSGTPGDTYFDEVRVATTWEGVLNITPATPDNPASISVTGDGPQMARLAWTKNASNHNVMVLYRTSAITGTPTNSIAYSVGSVIDGATVIYNGSATELEHVLSEGATAYYKFYSVNANFYSSGLTNNVTLSTYGDGIIDQFSYTNSTSLSGGNTGKGWSGAWSIGSGSWTNQRNTSPTFTTISNYPAVSANRVKLTNPGSNGSAAASRSFAAISSGTIYVAAYVAYNWEGSNKWAGISLMDGSTERAFFGKGWGPNWYTFGLGDGSGTYFSSKNMRGQEQGSDKYYLVVGKYDIANGRIDGKIYDSADTFPESEPTSWDVTRSGLTLGAVSGIRLGAGATSGGAIGDCWFDDLRVGTNWNALVAGVCPTWMGNETRTPSGNVYLGDSIAFKVESYPIGAGQQAKLVLRYGDGTASTNAMSWWKNESNNSFWTNLAQMVKTGTHTNHFTVSLPNCSQSVTAAATIVVQALNPPASATATRDNVNTNSQINLAWTKNAQSHDVIVMRNTTGSFTAPTQGTTYYDGGSVGGDTVVYRGSATSFNDTGLAPSTTYYYRFYSVNGSYYSTGIDSNATTAAGSQNITVDGNPADWVGTAPTVINSGTMSVNEYIWRDRTADVRTDNGNHPNAELREFRVFADETNVWFLVKLADITDVAHPHIAIGVDTRRSGSSTGMNWMGDDAGIYLGSDYFGGGAAAHYPQRNITLHSVGGTPRIELYNDGGSSWYGPDNSAVAFSAANNAIEARIPRSALGLTGSVTGRFTVAAFLNNNTWANDGDATAQIAANTPDGADSLAIAPYDEDDGALSLSAWREDISDSDLDFWFDLRFGTAALQANTVASAPANRYPTNNASVAANPVLSWNASTDSDGQVTSYFLEVGTNSNLSGVDGTENGSILLRVNLPATQTNYTLSTSSTQYFWRVRARDTAGALSSGAIERFVIGGKTDVEGPIPTLLYIGTNVQGFLNGDYNDHISRYGWIQSVTDAEVRQTNSQIGYVLRWEDASGVYVTNKQHAGGSSGAFTYNIIAQDGRVSPNWDIVEIDTVANTNREWGIDVAFHATNVLAQGNSGLVATTYVHRAFTISNYNEALEYYLTVSAEDSCTEGGSWWSYGTWNSFGSPGAPYWGGYAADGPNTARNVTTNFLIRIQVTDDDRLPPAPSTAQGWAQSRSLLVTNNTGTLGAFGTGLQTIYSAYDGQLAGRPLSLLFNAFDFYSGLRLTASGPASSNTTVAVGSWTTNNFANYSASLSNVADTRNSNTVAAWHWSNLTYNDLTTLWGGDGSGVVGQTNPVTASLWDADDDRLNDQGVASNTLFGYLQVQDDDTEAPEITEFTVGGAGGFGTSNLNAGSIAIIGVNGSVTTAPERFSFVVLNAFPAGTIIDFVDCGWNYTSNSWHRITEFHTNRWVATGNLDVGNVVELTLLNINNDGDQVVVYQYSGTGGASNDPNNVTFISAVNLDKDGDGWDDPADLIGGGSKDDNVHSSIYRGLTNGVTAVSIPLGGGKANARYTGPTSGTSAYLRNQINNAANWTALADGYQNITNYSFTITGAGGGGVEWSTSYITDAHILSGGYIVSNVVQDTGKGLLAANTSYGVAPYFKMYNTNGVLVMSNAFPLGFSTGETNRQTLTLVAPATPYNQIVLGAWSSVTAVADADNDRAGDNRRTEWQLDVNVIDDDPDRPAVPASPLAIGVGTNALSATTVATNLIAAWNFNSSNAVVSHGSGTLSNNASAVTYLAGATTNAYASDVAGAALSVEGNGNNTRYLQFAFSMAGFDGLRMSFAAQKSSTGFNNNQVSYSINGTDFTNFGAAFNPVTDSFGVHTFDFNSVTDLNGATGVHIRIVLNGASGGSGSIRFDNVRFEAVPSTFLVTDGQLASVAPANPLVLSFKAHDAYSGLFRGTTGDGSNMHINVQGWLTNNTAAFDAAGSSADSTNAAATNVWRFTSFGYDQIGDLYGNGQTSRSVMATMADIDDDRPGDTLWRSNHVFGALRVIDDDTNAPVAAAFAASLGTTPLSTSAGADAFIAAWNFNASNTVVNHGTGSMTHNLLGTISYFGGDAINAYGGDAAGSAFSPVGTNNNAGYLQFQVSMAGRQDLVATYATRGTPAGFTTHAWSWSTDGSTFTALTNITGRNVTTYSLQTVDFSSVPDLDNAPAVYLRCTLSGATDGAGNNRFDNFQFNATAASGGGVLVVTDGQLAAVTPAAPLRFTFGAYDLDSGIHRGTAANGSNMHVTAPGIAFENTINYNAGLSSPDTQAAAATSVWDFTAFTYNQIGTLYDDGSNIIDITATAMDRDNDRTNDNLRFTNQLYGQLTVTDDDTLGPPIPGALVYDPFTDGGFTQGTDPYDVAWFLQNSNMSRQVASDTNGINHGNALFITATNGGSLVGPAGQTLSLTNENDSVSFSFRLRLTNTVTDLAGFRFGMYDHVGLAVGADQDGNSEDDRGYYVVFGTGNENGAAIGKEGGTNTTILGGTDTNVLASAPSFNLAPNTVYLVQLRADRMTNGVRLVLNVDDTEVLSASDTNTFYTNFNSMAFHAVAGQGVALDDIALAKSSITVDKTGWTNDVNFAISWATNAVSDPSGIGEYRLVTNGVPPTSATNGLTLGLTDTANVEIRMQGRRTNFVFAVDNDNDRPSDRAKGPPGFFVTMLDTTRPDQATGLVVTNDAVADPQSMVEADWFQVASMGGEGADPLSPFAEYRVYYWVTNNGVAITNYQTIALTSTDTNTVVTNLAPGVEYDFAVAARDRAGNLGPLSAPFRFGTQPFFITNGVAISANEVRFRIRTAHNGNYDLLHANVVDYGDHLTNQWTQNKQFAGQAGEFTVTNDIFTVAQPRSQIRFYRAAPRGRWTNGLPFRSASKEVYAVKQTPLYAGQNWVAFPAVPDSNRVDMVLGTYLPAGGTLVNATRVQWFTRSPTNAILTNQLYLLDSVPRRWTSNGADDRNDTALPLADGFVVRLPDGMPPTNLLLVGRIPLTNQVQQLAGNQSYNLISARSPESLHPSNLFATVDIDPASGHFTGGLMPIPHPTYGSDMIWKFDRNSQRVPNIIYYRTSPSAGWYTDAGAPVPDNYFQPDDAIIFFAGRSTMPISLTNVAAGVGGGTGAPKKWSEPTINITP